MSNIPRREVLGNMGKAVLGSGVVAAAVAGNTALAAEKKKRWGMLVDLRRCIGCKSCAVACKAENNVPLGVFRRRVRTHMSGAYPEADRHFTPISCFHCEDPGCLPKCKNEAIYKTEDGLVLIDPKKCKKTKRCQTGCPYRNVFVNPLTNKSDKCTFCQHRIAKGVTPACVQTCTGKALMFGDLNDSGSEISKAIAASDAQVLKPEEETKPSLYYIGLEPKIHEQLRTILAKKRQIRPNDLETDR